MSVRSIGAVVSKPFFVFRKISSRHVIAACAFLLAALFVYASVSKLWEYDEFVKSLEKSPITKGYENIVAWLVPGIELAIAAMLIIPRTRIKGLWLGLFTMLGFTVYVYALPTFFNNAPCSCGGIISKLTWKEHFYFNSAFTLLAGLGLFLNSPATSRKKTSG